MRQGVLAFAILAILLQPVRGEQAASETANTIEFPSPDGRFAFRYAAKPDGEGKTYNLVEKNSGKVLTSVAESDDNLGPSARFLMKVLWRKDSSAFAVTATLWKRGSTLFVYLRDGATFRAAELPKLEAEITDRAMRGKSFPHVVEISSQEAKRWQNDGSLALEVESMQDGNGSLITAKRAVTLGFPSSGRAKVLKSTIKFTTEAQ